MDKKTFETLAAVGKLDAVVFYQIAPNSFELRAYSAKYKGGDGFKTALGERRVWASVDTLLGFVRNMGYAGKITIETPKFELNEEGVQQALRLCIEFEAIKRCELHEDEYIDNMLCVDPEELANDILKSEPEAIQFFESEYQMVMCIKEALSMAGEECSSCARNHDSD